MTSPLFRREAIEHQRERLWGDVLLIQPVSFYLISAAILLVFISLVLFLVYGHYARRESVQGYLVPDKGIIKVRPHINGVILKRHIEENQTVAEGDMLFTISTQRAGLDSADIDGLILQQLKQTRDNLTLKIEQQGRVNVLEEQRLEAQIAGLKQEIERLEQQTKTLLKRVELSESRLNDMQRLLKQKHVAEQAYKQAYDDHLDNRSKLEDSRRLLINQENQLNDLIRQQEQFPLISSSQISDLNNQLAEIEQRLYEIEGRRHYTIRAPIDGRISSIQGNSGQLADSNKPLLAILPLGAQMQAELFVPARAIGFIENGQNVFLRYSAFPYQRYGLYEGTIVKVSSSILSPQELSIPLSIMEPVYRVTASLDSYTIKAYGKEFPLQAGMLLDADIILETRSLWEWFLEPVLSLRGRLQ